MKYKHVWIGSIFAIVIMLTYPFLSPIVQAFPIFFGIVWMASVALSLMGWVSYMPLIRRRLARTSGTHYDASASRIRDSLRRSNLRRGAESSLVMKGLYVKIFSLVVFLQCCRLGGPLLVVFIAYDLFPILAKNLT